ncbi:hypothetical protein NOS3756_48250 [Nostoc sp. NIES-3756]|uniref:hypothetical protein n=1 Tax=Nostoc sp. NIES-3756 TaxID=1751286 RepID=UPI000721068C|nr:hypothetical protein [Nostoc sp. NIES-3756]BAT55832.1 hypothetical protein NOS3756_48250 [Nostoc sp. NIES-3756]BAY36407.1 hypothetical protein NIES2111_07340 [Nostoc sp. NIES-2111]
MNIYSHKQMKSLLLTLATACGTALSFTTTFNSAIASELTASTNSVVNSKTIAQVRSCPKYAGGGRLAAQIETRNFLIHFCNRRGKLFYTGISKRDGKGIYSLPAYTEEGTGYVVKNGKYEYIVTGASLDILRNGKVIQSEQVIKYVSGYSN